MSKTVQQIVDSVKDHLGNRASGFIGSRAVDTVVLDAINQGILKIAKSKKHIAAFEKLVSINVTSAGYQYPLPVLDSLGTTIKIKKFLRFVIRKPAETTGYEMARISTFQRDRMFPLTNNTRTGRPSLYSIYGSMIEIWPFPDDTYTMTGRAITWPTPLLIGAVDTTLGLEFDDVIEFFATAECFSRLQQNEDSLLWERKFKGELATTLASLDDYPDEAQFPYDSSSLIGPMENIGPTSTKSRSYNSALGIP